MLLFYIKVYIVYLIHYKLKLQRWDPDSKIESWRLALETEFTSYTSLHYKHGTCSVFAKEEDSSTIITACIEDHEFQAKNFWFVNLIIGLKT